MKKKIVSSILCVMLAASMLVGCGGSNSSEDGGKEDAKTEEGGGTEEGMTEGKNTFVDGGTELSLWTFQELHVGFYTTMADLWNKENPDNPINLTVTTGESHSLQSKLLVACQAGEGTPDIADIERGWLLWFFPEGWIFASIERCC